MNNLVDNLIATNFANSMPSIYSLTLSFLSLLGFDRVVALHLAVLRARLEVQFLTRNLDRLDVLAID